TLEWERGDLIADYPASGGWTLTYKFNSRSPAGAFTITASLSGDKYVVSVVPATTDGYVASNRKVTGQSGYIWTAVMSGAGGTFTVDSGTCDVQAKVSTSAGQDARSHVKKVLDALEATIEGKATTDQLNYAIAGRSLSRMTPEQLIVWREKYRAEYLRELNAERIANGLGVKNQVKVRFGGVR
ncbi:MAG: hypothetical protein ACREI9_12435, partial [Nitrospiraceae bacterium]